MFQRVLVPLDGSARAEAVLPAVTDLARHYGATLTLLQVVRLVLPGVSEFELDAVIASQALEQQLSQARSYLAMVQRRLTEQGVAVETRVSRGGVVEEILRVAGEENADLIAMASHGHSGLSRVFYGSVAAGVIHRVDRPLLLVRSRADP